MRKAFKMVRTRAAVVLLTSVFGLSACGKTVVAPSTSPPPAPSAAEQAKAPDDLTQLRQQVTFPILVPAQVPEGLRAGTPWRKPESSPIIHIPYVDEDGTQGLSVANGPSANGLDADPRKTGKSVKIRDSITAHFLTNQPEFGGSILWWNESGAYVAISGPYLTEEDLVRIAASMSPDAMPQPGPAADADDGASSHAGGSAERMPAPTPERYVLKLFKGDGTPDIDAWAILTTLPAINWSVYGKESGGRTMELLQWLDNRQISDVTEVTYILKGTTGLDGAFADQYCTIVGTLLTADPAIFVKALGQLTAAQSDQIISFTAYYACGRSDTASVQERLKSLLDSSDLAAQQKERADKLLRAISSPPWK